MEICGVVNKYRKFLLLLMLLLFCTCSGYSNIHIGVDSLSVESQKDIDAVKRCSIENQKGTITEQGLWQ